LLAREIQGKQNAELCNSGDRSRDGHIVYYYAFWHCSDYTYTHYAKIKPIYAKAITIAIVQ